MAMKNSVIMLTPEHSVDLLREKNMQVIIKSFDKNKNILLRITIKYNATYVLSCRIFTHLAALFHVAMWQKIKSTNQLGSHPI